MNRFHSNALRFIPILAAMLGMGASLFGQATMAKVITSTSETRYTEPTYVPSTPQSIATQTVKLTYMRFTNDDASAVGVIRVINGSTLCGGSPCPIVGDVTIQPKTTYIVPLAQGGEMVFGSLTWSVTGSTKVVGYAEIRY